MKLILLIIALTPFTQLTWAQEENKNWGVIISAAEDPSENHILMYNEVRQAALMLLDKGVPRDHIFVAYASGQSDDQESYKWSNWGFVGGSSDYVDTPKSFLNDDTIDVKYPATEEGLKNIQKQLQKRIKNGDHVLFYLGGHRDDLGDQPLWDGGTLTLGETEDLFTKRQLPGNPPAVIPFDPSITFHIIANNCHSGTVLGLTDINACVMATSDKWTRRYIQIADHKVNQDENLFHDFFMADFRKELKPENRSLLDAFQEASKNDRGSYEHVTSLDYLLRISDRLGIQEKKNADFMERQLCLDRPNQLITHQWLESIEHILSRLDQPRRHYYEEHLAQKISALKQRIIEIHQRHGPLIRELDVNMSKARDQWDALPEKEKSLSLATWTYGIEILRINRNNMETRFNQAIQEYKTALKELDFITYSTDEQFELYKKVKECLEYKF